MFYTHRAFQALNLKIFSLKNHTCLQIYCTLLVFLLRKEWKRAAVPALFLLFSYLIFQQNVRGEGVPRSGEPQYKVLTYNLGAFEFNKKKVARVLDLVNEIEPDFIEDTGLKVSLTPSRANGFFNIFQMMKKKAWGLHLGATE